MHSDWERLIYSEHKCMRRIRITPSPAYLVLSSKINDTKDTNPTHRAQSPNPTCTTSHIFVIINLSFFSLQNKSHWRWTGRQSRNQIKWWMELFLWLQFSDKCKVLNEYLGCSHVKCLVKLHILNLIPFFLTSLLFNPVSCFMSRFY